MVDMFVKLEICQQLIAWNEPKIHYIVLVLFNGHKGTGSAFDLKVLSGNTCPRSLLKQVKKHLINDQSYGSQNYSKPSSFPSSLSFRQVGRPLTKSTSNPTRVLKVKL